MQNFTLAQKQTLQTMVQNGSKVAELAYNPNTVIGNPETTATSNGWTQYYREATTDLVEVIYTK